METPEEVPYREHPTRNVEEFRRDCAYFQYLWLERYSNRPLGAFVEHLIREGWVPASTELTSRWRQDSLEQGDPS